MALRLSHVLGGMLLVLLAGVLSVWHIEQRLGGATVPGVVVLEATWLDATALDALAAGRPGARVGTVEAGPGALAPFDDTLVARLRRRGDITLLYAADRDLAREQLVADGSVWGSILDSFEAGTGVRHAVELAAVFVRGQSGTRAFLVGLALGAEPPDDEPDTLLAPLEAALTDLPSFRRGSLVVLGARSPDGRRPYLRLDVGPWKGRARGELADLLEPGW